MPRPHLLLAGLGHAHLFVLEALASGALDANVTVVTPEEYHYSGMIPGVLAGCYTADEAALPPARLVRGTGVEWVRGRIARVHAEEKQVVLENGGVLSYDLLSLDIGSRPAADDLPGVCDHATPVKPVGRTLVFREAAVRAADSASAATPARVVIVGGGAAGVEIAFCLGTHLAGRCGRERFRISIFQSADAILPEYPGSFREKARTELERRRVELRTGVEVRGVEERRVITEHGEPVPYDALLWATGPRAPSLLRASGLPVDEKGYLRVQPTLRASGHAEVFGAGDCMTPEHAPWVPKAGVYAVREGPVLARNLARALKGEPLEEYEPQRDWLSLMNTGDGRALLHYRGLTHHGRTAWWLKDRIDRRFVARFQRLGR
ncbi:MAG: FAD-dependent oxidoreductase [Gemmatimonadetes bacterium]|nr:FAD-dependent oxidoreductase [Gemmatimonadota bacterium]